MEDRHPSTPMRDRLRAFIDELAASPQAEFYDRGPDSLPIATSPGGRSWVFLADLREALSYADTVADRWDTEQAHLRWMATQPGLVRPWRRADDGTLVYGDEEKS